MSKTYIGISRDHSASMRPLANKAAVDYNALISTIKTQSAIANQDTIVSVVICGAAESRYSNTANVKRVVVNSSVNALQPLAPRDYNANGASTPLFDSIGDLIEQLSAAPDANDSTTAFLVMAITDGEENASIKWTASSLRRRIQELQATGRWSFVLRVPPRRRSNFSSLLGIPADNVQEWQLTVAGLTAATQETEVAFTQYFTERAAGIAGTTKFYTNLSNVSQKEVKAALTDISTQVKLWITTQKEVIRPYCERMSQSPFIKGAAFYQLTKTEPEVQDYKKIAIRDKQTGHIYAGTAARQMLGLPSYGTAYVKPGDHGQYDIFIQSTSINRALPPGTQVLYWTGHNDPIVASAPATPTKTANAPKPPAIAKKTPVQQPVTPMSKLATVPALSMHSDDYIAGYKQGFPAGRAKMTASMLTPHSVKTKDYALGYNAGYKDGRGKKKRLYK